MFGILQSKMLSSGVSNWNGYQLVISMAGAPNKTQNHIYLLYSELDEIMTSQYWKMWVQSGYNALLKDGDQQWSWFSDLVKL